MKLILSLAIILCAFKSQAQVNVGDSVKDHKPGIDSTVVFTKTEIEAAFLGGDMAWQRFLSKNMNDPNSDDTKKVVVVKFIVELNGATSEIGSIINAFNDNACRDEAKRLIKKSSGYWKPAIQNGRLVRAYKTMSIEF